MMLFAGRALPRNAHAHIELTLLCCCCHVTNKPILKICQRGRGGHMAEPGEGEGAEEGA